MSKTKISTDIETKEAKPKEKDYQLTYSFFILKIGILSPEYLHLFIKYPEANKRQLTSLAGLDPVEFTSGSSINKKAKISKAGAKLYRGTLFMGAMVASKNNQELSLFFNRLKENGKHTTVAHIAVMRKMIIIAHSLFKNNQKYSSEIYNSHCGVHFMGK